MDGLDLLKPTSKRLVRGLLHKADRNADAPGTPLFDGEDAMFKRVVSSARVYGEYGVGASTGWVYENTTAKIVAVETSSDWASSVVERKDPQRISVATVDCGPVGDWGRPLSYQCRDQFQTYFEQIWMSRPKPDTVLIDGRFRVCCFLTSLVFADPGAKIIFDDYRDRAHYHVVEEVLRPVERCGRQALFELIGDFDRSLAGQLAHDFRMVMD